MRHPRYSLGIIALLAILATLPVAAQTLPESQAAPAAAYTLYLPITYGQLLPPNPFGFDLRSYSSDAAFKYAREANPKWIRAGDLSWADVEAVRGSYRWDALAVLDSNIRRIRAAGMEPLVVIQRTPSWAQYYPGRLCSPMKPEFVPDFARFARALAARYATGPLAVHYWEIWNEPDMPSSMPDDAGVGCWLDANRPYYGGQAYGEMVKQVGPALKAGNPAATVLAGALAYDSSKEAAQSFLQGLFASGAADFFDLLSFHAYGEWGANDMMVSKALQIRQVAAAAGHADKQLFATEIAAMCSVNLTCPANFAQRQANFTARIYALALALKLKGALWYTLAISNPGFRYSQLVDVEGAKLSPRPAFYAFRNSARLLEGAQYVGPALRELPPEQLHSIQALTFRKARSSFDPTRGSTLYVVWVAEPEDVQSYAIPVPRGVRAICTDQLSGDPYTTNPDKLPRTHYCAPANPTATQVWIGVGPMPIYVEVPDA